MTRGDPEARGPASDLERAGSTGGWLGRDGEVRALALPLRSTGANAGWLTGNAKGADNVVGETGALDISLLLPLSLESISSSGGGKASNRNDLGRAVLLSLLAIADRPTITSAVIKGFTDDCSTSDIAEVCMEGGVSGEPWRLPSASVSASEAPIR